MFDNQLAQRHSLFRLSSVQAASLHQSASVQKYCLQAEAERQTSQDAFAQWINEYGSLGLDLAATGEDFTKVADIVSMGFKCLLAF